MTIEFLDVYDGNRNRIGTACRDVVHALGLWHNTVHCWVVWDGKMVFQRRSRNTGDKNAGKLYTTASGHVSAGETLEVAFAREVMQEVGLTIANPNPMGVIVWVSDIRKKDGTIMVDRAYSNMFWAEHKGAIEDFRFDDGEVDGVVAIDLAEFLNWCSAEEGALEGVEWDGVKLSRVTLTADDFARGDYEIAYSKYQPFARAMERGLKKGI